MAEIDGVFPMLAFDLSTPLNLAMICRDPDNYLSRSISTDKRAEFLFPAIEELLRESGISAGSLKSIGAGRGPGSFTGIRNAVMAAKTLSYALGIPLYSPSTLDILAMGVKDRGLVASLIDARRGEVYCCVYDASDGSFTRFNEPRALRPEEAAALLENISSSAGKPLRMVGTGAHIYRELFSALGDIHEGPSPSAQGLLKACLFEASLRGSSDPLSITPMYLRAPDSGGGGRPGSPEQRGAGGCSG